MPGSAGEKRQQGRKQDLTGAIADAIPGSMQTGIEKLTGMKDSSGRITKSRTIPKLLIIQENQHVAGT